MRCCQGRTSFRITPSDSNRSRSIPLVGFAGVAFEAVLFQQRLDLFRIAFSEVIFRRLADSWDDKSDEPCHESYDATREADRQP
jgi:hypothetical protein